MVSEAYTYEVEKRCVDPGCGQRGAGHDDAQRPGAQSSEVEEGGLLGSRVFLLDLSPLVLEVQDGPALRVIEGRRPVEDAQEERQCHQSRSCLQPVAPAQGTGTNDLSRRVTSTCCS